MAAMHTEVKFDYETSKALYMAQVKKCFDEDSTHSETTIQKTIMKLKASAKTHLHKNYEVSYSFGREILIEKRKLPEDTIVQVLTFEDVFDIFIKYHIGNNHMGGRQHLSQIEKKLLFSYKFPVICLSLLVKNCNVCKSRHRKPVATVNKVSSVYVTVMIQKKKYPAFRYLLIYIDRATDFIFLRPLKQKTDLEISMEIFKILMQCGPPQKLCLYGYNRDFNKKVGSVLRQVCPMFDFSIEYRSANFDPSAVVIDKLYDWMNQNASVMWEIGCSIVQRELNTSLQQKIHRTEDSNDLSPHDLVYGKNTSETELPTIQTYNQGFASENSVIKLFSDPNEPDRYVFKKSETSKSGAASHYRNLETVVDDDIVELRIPSPENYELDLLSQFEDSEISQEVIDDTVKESKTLKSKPQRASSISDNLHVRMEDESEGLLFTDAITSNKKEEIVNRVKDSAGEPSENILDLNTPFGNMIKTNKNKINQTLHPLHDNDVPNNSIASIRIEANNSMDIPDLDCEVFTDSDISCNLDLSEGRIDNEKGEKNSQEISHRKMSLRSAKKVDISMEKTTEDLRIDDGEEMNGEREDEDLIYNPDVALREEKDPLDIDEETTQPIDIIMV